MSRYYLGRSPRNPYVLPRRKRLWGRWAFLIVVGLFVGFLLLMFSTAFAITEVRVEGATDVDAIRTAAQEKISGWSRLPTFQTSRVKRRLTGEEFAFESVEVEKDYPHTLVVRVVERAPRAVWQTATKAWLLDQTGQGIGNISLTEPRRAGLTYFFDESSSTPETQNITPDRFILLLEIEERLRKEQSLEIVLIKTASPNGAFIKFLTSEGWELYFDASTDLEAQLEKLTTVLTTAADIRPTLHYIDVRFADRVYYQ